MHRIHHFDIIDSTQIEARKEVYQSGDAIIADQQTAGYGRRGRDWKAPIGNLFVTLVEDYTGIQQLSWLPYAVGLALYDAIYPLLNPSAQLNLKWPNDLLINNEKLSGILLEVEGDKILIGIGVNIAVVPETDQPVTALNSHTQTPHQAMDILEGFLARFDHWCDRGEKGGFASMRPDWLARAAYIGKEIKARLADGIILTGVFKDIDPDGALVLMTESGHYTVTAADIYFTKKKNDEKTDPR